MVEKADFGKERNVISKKKADTRGEREADTQRVQMQTLPHARHSSKGEGGSLVEVGRLILQKKAKKTHEEKRK